MFIHSSDEFYGADRILLLLVGAIAPMLIPEVWLPTDLEHPETALCDELRRRGIEVRHVPLPILRRAYRNPRDLIALAVRAFLLWWRLRSARPRLVYCTTSAVLPVAPIARVAGVPSVAVHVQEIWSGFERRVLALLARACGAVLAISRPVAEALPVSLRERCTVVLNAVPDLGDVPRTDSAELSFLVASRWNAWKGHGTLLAAWDEGDFGHLVVLGGPPPSGASVDVPALVGRLRRPESVTIVGEVLDPAPFFHAADVVLLPSDEPEPFGLVVIEAFSAGAAVVVSAAGGPARLVEEGITGWLFAPRDVSGLAHVLALLDREHIRRAGRAARSRYEQDFGVERYAREWSAVVARLLADS